MRDKHEEDVWLSFLRKMIGYWLLIDSQPVSWKSAEEELVLESWMDGREDQYITDAAEIRFE